MENPPDDEHKEVPLKQARAFFTANPTVETLRLWATKGVQYKPIAKNATPRKPVVLKTSSEGKTYFTTRAWAREFQEACTKARSANKGKR